LTGVDNRSGFPAELLSLPDLDGQEVEMLVVSATWVYSETNEWNQAIEQPEICFADQYFGEPSPWSSVMKEAQTATEKLLVDVLVNGTAYAPQGVPVRSVVVGLYARNIAKQVRVVGDRYLTSLGPSSPAEFTAMPVVYERAYGGSDSGDPGRKAAWRQNPAGLGFRGIGPRSRDIITEYPNLEPIAGPLEGPPAGFGIISRGWSPRLEFAGTFDREWLDTQWPLMPLDFDVRHNQSVSPDQQTASLHTGDSVRLLNLTPDGVWEFAMPSTELPVWLMTDDVRLKAHPRMDTVTIEPDRRSVTLIFRLKLPYRRGVNRLREIVIGPVTPGYLRAKERSKTYLNLRDLKKVTRDLPS
jgi:hypothetical protein